MGGEDLKDLQQGADAVAGVDEEHGVVLAGGGAGAGAEDDEAGLGGVAAGGGGDDAEAVEFGAERGADGGV